MYIYLNHISIYVEHLYFFYYNIIYTYLNIDIIHTYVCVCVCVYAKRKMMGFPLRSIGVLDALGYIIKL